MRGRQERPAGRLAPDGTGLAPVKGLTQPGLIFASRRV